MKKILIASFIFSTIFMFVGTAQSNSPVIDDGYAKNTSSFSYHDLILAAFNTIPMYFEEVERKRNGGPCMYTDIHTGQCSSVGVAELVAAHVFIIVGLLLIFLLSLKLFKRKRFSTQRNKKVMLTLWSVFITLAILVDVNIERGVLYVGMFFLFYILLMVNILLLKNTSN